VFVIHQEGDGGAVFSTAKAVVKLLYLADCKRGRFFGVKRAAGLEFAAGFLERNARIDKLNDIGAVEYFIDKRLGNATCHTV